MVLWYNDLIVMQMACCIFGYLILLTEDFTHVVDFARRMANKWNDINWDSFFWGSRNNPDKNTPGKVYVYADTCKDRISKKKHTIEN